MATIDNYIPTPVPFGIGSGELRRFLDNELYQIAEQLSLLVQLSAHGGLTQIGGQALSITGTPQKLPFTAALPERDVTGDVANDEIVIEEDGDYALNFFTNMATSNSIVLTFQVYINGLAVGPVALSEIIQQESGRSFSASTIVALSAGDKLSMYVSGSPSRTVTFDNVNYYVVRL